MIFNSQRLILLFVVVFSVVTRTSVFAQSGVCFSSFSDHTFQISTGELLDAFTIADFNKDGKPDMVGVSAYGLSVMLGDGKGGLQPSVNTEFAAHLFSIVNADFNEDGNLDVAVAVIDVNILMVYFGDGAGGFSQPNGLAAGTTPRSIIKTDFNNDGHLDLAAANSASDNVSVLIGDGAGNFADPVNFAVGPSPYMVTSGDFNGDGQQDLATANLSPTNNVSVLLGNGAGNFSPAVNYTVGQNNEGINSGDFNGDGNWDLAIVNGYDALSIMLSDATGTLTFLSTYPIYGPLSVTNADLNKDGKLDLAVIGAGGLSVFAGDGSGGFVTLETLASTGTMVSTADINNDGDLDLCASTGDFILYLGDGIGHFGKNAEAIPMSFSAIEQVKGDFNNDGKMDLVMTQQGTDDILIMIGDGVGGFVTSTMNVPGADTGALTKGDFNSDGKLDIAIAMTINSDDAVLVLLGNGSGGFSVPVSYTVGPTPRSIASGDFNGDGKTDLAVTNAYPSGSTTVSHISVLFGDGAGNFGALSSTLVNLGVGNIAAGDYNGDGVDDITIPKGLYVVSVFIGNTSGVFSAPVDYQWFTGSPTNIFHADLNKDGKLDMLLVNSGGSGSGVMVSLNNGDGTFGQPVAYNCTGRYGWGVTVDDFNNDGNPDVALGTNNGVFVFLGSPTGALSAPIDVGGSIYRSVNSFDYNGDGRIDLVGGYGTFMMLMQNNTATVAVAGNTSFCAGGSVTLQANANGDLFSWNPGGSTNQNLFVTLGGTYHVTVTNQNGTCSSVSKDITVSVPPAAPAVTITQPTCVLSTGTVSVVLQNVSDTYSFDNGSTFQSSNSKSGLAPGAYHVITRTSAGCSTSPATATVVAAVIPSTPLAFGFPTDCNVANGAITVVMQDGGETYSFDNGTTFQDSYFKTNLPEAVYPVVIKSRSGCLSPVWQTPVYRNSPSLPIVDLVQPSCEIPSGAITVHVQHTDDIYSFDNGTTFQASNSALGLASASYDVVIKNSGSCVSFVTLATINTPPAIPATPAVTLTQPTCSTVTGVIAVTVQNGADTYSFDNGTNFQIDNNSAALTQGTYNVVIKSADGCLSQAQPAVINYQPITPSMPIIASTQPTCAMATGSVSVSVQDVNETYSFDNGITFQTSNQSSALTTGTYGIVIKSSGGCVSSSASTTINSQPISPSTPGVTLTQPTCNTATGAITVTVQEINETYSFDNGATFQISNTNSTLTAGTYNVTIKGTDGCTSVASAATINVQPVSPSAPTVTLTQPTCTTATGTVTVTTQNSGETYSFDNGTTFQSSNINSSLAVGTYDVMIMNAGGCVSSSTSATINAQPATPTTPAVALTQPTCSTATGTVTVTTQNSGETYSFDNGTTFQSSNSNSSLAAGTYEVMISSTGGCVSSSTSATINAPPVTPSVPMVTLTQPTCTTATGSISVTVQNTNDTYSFDNGITFQTSNSKSLTTGNYSVIINSADGCASSITSAAINVQPLTPAQPTITVDDTNPAAPILTANAASAYQWFKDGGMLSNEVSGSITVTSPGSYSVIVTNVEGCSSIASNPTVVVITGLELPSNSDVLFYPNPVSEQLSIRWVGFQKSGNFNVSIFNLLGSVVDKRRITCGEETSIDVSSFASGLYILQLQQEEKIVQKPFIKK